MHNVMVSKDIVPIAKFKAGIAQWFNNLQSSGHPLIITQNGIPAGVLLSPIEYDELVYRKVFMDSVERGVQDANNKEVLTTKQLTRALKANRNRG